MATGTLVIAFRKGAIAEIIQQGETGFLVKPGACSRAATLVKDLTSISRKRCRASIAGRFPIGKRVENYEHIYTTVTS
jgi:glycosyltransferase involved in cell wall biosynthesis